MWDWDGKQQTLLRGETTRENGYKDEILYLRDIYRLESGRGRICRLGHADAPLQIFSSQSRESLLQRRVYYSICSQTVSGLPTNKYQNIVNKPKNEFCFHYTYTINDKVTMSYYVEYIKKTFNPWNDTYALPL